MSISRVAIIGGGPSGSLFALYLLHYARRSGRQYDVTIYQDKDFNELGPKGCKGCAGILSISLVESLKELGLMIPENIIQSKIEQYAVHSPYNTISISNPDKGVKIFSVYRGGGPRVSSFTQPVTFDGWLLNQAVSQGVKLEQQRVTRVFLEPRPRLTVADEKVDFDLVVLASGVNGKATPVHGLKHTPARTQTMAQDELYAGAEAVSDSLGNMAHVFLIPKSGLVFGSLVPKGDFINVSLLSTGKIPVSVADFLGNDLVTQVLPQKYERVCGCRPRTLINPASNYYADGFVSIGDAAITRLYKDGLGSSATTARTAARTVVEQGCTARDFKRYYQPICQNLNTDNRWGKLLFGINNRAKNSRAFLTTQRFLIGDEQYNTAGSQPFTRAAWGMFTGGYTYRAIAKMVFSPISVGRLLVDLIRESVSGIFNKEPVYPRQLHVGGRKILILGSGFGGAYCLNHLVHSLDRNENVTTTIVSNENFFLFSPLLHEVATGSIETRHITYPIRRLNWRDRFTFIQAEVKEIDMRGRRVVTSNGILDYDYLILALGSVTDKSELAAPGENVFTLKTLWDAVLIRNHIIATFEQANTTKDQSRQKQLLTFVVSGGGYVGIQLITQIRDLVRKNMLKFYKEVDPANVKLILVEAEAKIVASMHTKLGAYIMKNLQQTGIDVRLKSRVTWISKDEIEINGEQVVPAGTLIWVTGVIANPVIAGLPAQKDRQGRVMVNEYLEVYGFPGVFAVGDCARFDDPITGRPIPPRAHVAVRQAKVVARNLLAEIRGKDKKPYYYDNSSEVVSLGDTGAIFRFHGLRLYGFPARFIWVAAYSLLVTGHYNRLSILTDWLFSWIFGRDITYLKLTGNETSPYPDNSVETPGKTGQG